MASVYQTHVKQALGLPTLPRRQDAATLEAKRQRMARQIERRRQALILGPTPWESMGFVVCLHLRSLHHPGNLTWVFPKMVGFPQIIHFNRVFQYKPSILGYTLQGTITGIPPWGSCIFKYAFFGGIC